MTSESTRSRTTENFGTLLAVKSLICEKGADPNLILPKKGLSAFHLAIGCDCTEFALKVTRFILQNGGDPNVKSEDGLTPVHIAAAWGRSDILRLLLGCGGDPEARDSNRLTPIHYAHKEAHRECLKMLAQHLQNKGEVLFAGKDQPPEGSIQLLFDKIVINNGQTIGEYKIEDKPDSIKSSSSNCNLGDLPQSNPKEFVMNWFNTHIDETYEKFLDGLDQSRSSDDSFESSIDESDNDNYRLSKQLNITFRKAYTKRRKVPKPIKPGRKLEFTSSESETENPKDEPIDVVNPKFVNFKESSMESGVVSVPSSKQIKESLNREEKACSKEVKVPESQPIPCVKVEACSGYKSYSIDKKQSLKNIVSNSSGYKSSASKRKTSSPLEKEVKQNKDVNHLIASQSSGYKSTTSESRNPPLNLVNNNELNQTFEVPAAGEVIEASQRPSTDVTPSFKTCSLLSNKFEKNVFEITEDLSGNSALNNVKVDQNQRVDGSESIASSEQTFVSVSEVYRYEDKQEGIVLYERRLLKPPSECNGTIRTTSSRMSSLPECFDYDSDRLRAELTSHGFEPGPITVTTKRVYLKKLYQLKRHQPVPTVVPATQKRVYSLELEKTLRDPKWTSDLACYKTLEEIVTKDFAKPEPSRKWREGVNKTSFTYLLLDPRISDNLPCRSDLLDPKDVWKRFLDSVFYVGKGKRSRPYSHLYEAVGLWRQGKPDAGSKKLKTILDIWRDGLGVVCLHIFQNTIPVEAYTREAAMISALKLDNLTNMKAGEFYGTASTWTQKQKRLLGVFLLHKAKDIFLSEGERQLYPQDIN
ncbi:unnamed protein product [Callosobruchus maculatus]|uniref:LEM domain-containing protein n=1 Tax=Callosobruchus maculatus TaxID=64391 RepID=A0A653BXI1_CALMS|nr:unnamed protein product [Callosobruchus maculatus]